MSVQAHYNFKIVKTHINNIQVGDIIEHNNKHRTVCKNNIGHCSILGRSLFGDSFKSGHTPVKKVVIITPKPNLH